MFTTAMCVRILLYMCPYEYVSVYGHISTYYFFSPLTRKQAIGTCSDLPSSSIYVSSYVQQYRQQQCYICVFYIPYTCSGLLPHKFSLPSSTKYVSSYIQQYRYCYICVFYVLLPCSGLYLTLSLVVVNMCPHTYSSISSSTAIYVSQYCYICVFYILYTCSGLYLTNFVQVKLLESKKCIFSAGICRRPCLCV